jgi:hypothetical protein
MHPVCKPPTLQPQRRCMPHGWTPDRTDRKQQLNSHFLGGQRIQELSAHQLQLRLISARQCDPHCHRHDRLPAVPHHVAGAAALPVSTLPLPPPSSYSYGPQSPPPPPPSVFARKCWCVLEGARKEGPVTDWRSSSSSNARCSA